MKKATIALSAILLLSANIVTASSYWDAPYEDAIPPSMDTMFCYDSDAGVGPQMFGLVVSNATGMINTYTDTCDGTILTEFQCGINGELIETSYDCGCETFHLEYRGYLWDRYYNFHMRGSIPPEVMAPGEEPEDGYTIVVSPDRGYCATGDLTPITEPVQLFKGEPVPEFNQLGIMVAGLGAIATVWMLKRK